MHAMYVSSNKYEIGLRNTCTRFLHAQTLGITAYFLGFK